MSFRNAFCTTYGQSDETDTVERQRIRLACSFPPTVTASSGGIGMAKKAANKAKQVEGATPVESTAGSSAPRHSALSRWTRSLTLVRPP